MGIELQPQQPKRTVEFNGEHFEIDEPGVLNASDIQRGDRVLVTTESGNRYMLRRSESRNGALMISNERQSNFNTFYPLHNPSETLAEVGKSMEFTAVTDEEKYLGSKMNSSTITHIEIRRGLDKAINNAPEGAGAKSIADMLKDHVSGKRRQVGE